MTKTDKSKLKPSGKSKDIRQRVLENKATPRKRVEDALKASEQNFRNLLDSSFVGIRILDENDNTLYANKALLDIFGYENLQEVIKSPPQEHYTPEAHASWVLRHEKLLRGEPIPNQMDIDIVRKDGTVRHLELSRKEVFWAGR